jgi:HD-GYP domain-containing protein (c-di-GMP phosphodiesterase class II)
MIVAYPIYGNKGELLLQRETELTSRNIAALCKRKVMAIYVKTGIMLDDELDSTQKILDESIRAETLALVQDWAEHRNPRTYTRIEETVKNIIKEIMNGKTPVYGLAEICTVDAYTYAHSVDVCILSAMVGCQLNYKKSDMLKLGIGSLLHDLGKVKIDNELLNKPDKLTDIEMLKIKRHPELGYEMLKQHDEISPASCSIVLNHHERYNGSGYPRGLSGEAINNFSSICGITDIYNALITDRVYRKAIPPNEVYEMLSAVGDRLFPLWTVKALLQCVSPYPVGTLIWLSTGDIALVVAVDHSLPLRPDVLILRTKEMVSLSNELSLMIVGQFSAEEAQELIMQYNQKAIAV